MEKPNNKLTERATTEARETMNTLSGMLDNATHCVETTAQKVKAKVEQGAATTKEQIQKRTHK